MLKHSQWLFAFLKGMCVAERGLIAPATCLIVWGRLCLDGLEWLLLKAGLTSAFFTLWNRTVTSSCGSMLCYLRVTHSFPLNNYCLSPGTALSCSCHCTTNIWSNGDFKLYLSPLQPLFYHLGFLQSNNFIIPFLSSLFHLSLLSHSPTWSIC